MSVIKNKRSLSELEFYHNAIEMRKEFTALLLKDFGIKDKVRTVSILARIYKIGEEDKEQLTEILKKYNMDNSVIEEYPTWIIEKMRESIMDILRNLIMNITHANSIYPTSREEFFERRLAQDRAIANCEQLLQEMQYVIEVLPVNAQKYMRHTEKIMREIALLKGWRKSDNKILKRIVAAEQ